MESKSASEKFQNSHLAYLNDGPLLRNQHTDVLDIDWLKSLLAATEREKNKYTLSLKDKKNPPKK